MKDGSAEFTLWLDAAKNLGQSYGSSYSGGDAKRLWINPREATTDRHPVIFSKAATAACSALSMLDAKQIDEALSAALVDVPAGTLATCALAAGRLPEPKARRVISWCKANLKTLRHSSDMDKSIALIKPLAHVMLPGALSMAMATERAWIAMQCASHPSIGALIHKEGLGLATLAAKDLPGALRGVNLDPGIDPQRNPRHLLMELLRQGLIDEAMKDASKAGMHQTLMRKSNDPDMALAALEAFSRSGMSPGAVYEGAHPLWIICDMRGTTHEKKQHMAFAKTMQLGFGPNMELPAGMELALSPTQRKNSAPNLPLEWARTRNEGIAEVARLCMPHGLDLEARNARGETILGALNRMARVDRLRTSAEKDFFVVHAMGADPLSIGPQKSSEAVAANDEMRRLAQAAAERRALRASLDESLIERAKALFALAKSQTESPRKPSPRL